MPSDAESKSDRCWEESSPIITELIDDLAGVTQSWVVAELAPRLMSRGFLFLPAGQIASLCG